MLRGFYFVSEDGYLVYPGTDFKVDEIDKYITRIHGQNTLAIDYRSLDSFPESYQWIFTVDGLVYENRDELIDLHHKSILVWMDPENPVDIRWIQEIVVIRVRRLYIKGKDNGLIDIGWPDMPVVKNDPRPKYVVTRYNNIN